VVLLIVGRVIPDALRNARQRRAGTLLGAVVGHAGPHERPPTARVDGVLVVPYTGGCFGALKHATISPAPQLHGLPSYAAQNWVCSFAGLISGAVLLRSAPQVTQRVSVSVRKPSVPVMVCWTVS